MKQVIWVACSQQALHSCACVWPWPFQALSDCVLSGPVIEVVLGRGGSFPEGICPEWGRLCPETKQEGAQVRRERLTTALGKHNTNWTDRPQPRPSKTIMHSKYDTMSYSRKSENKPFNLFGIVCFSLLMIFFNQLCKASFPFSN